MIRYAVRMAGIMLGVALAFPVSAIEPPAGQRVTDTSALLTAVQAATQGSVLTLAPAIYRVNLVIATPLQLRCEPGAVLDAGGQGDAIRIKVEGVQVQGCMIRNWGGSLTAMQAAVFIERNASGAHIENNHMQGPGFGVWVEYARDVLIRSNRIQGDSSLRSQDRGNGIHLFAVSHAEVADNEVWDVRDGIYIDTSNDSSLTGNYLHDLRYGVHYMYSNLSRVAYNRTRHTRTGYALMQSRQLEVIGNRSEEDQNYGILLNYITYSRVSDNEIVAVQSGTSGDQMIQGAEGKALHVFNSLHNQIEYNRFERSSLGVQLTAGSEHNRIRGNAFIHNQQQVKYVATRRQEWSYEGEGNYWSDYLGWDRNSDGIGDTPYEPNDNVDRLLWTYPQARLLMHSPAVDTLRWVQQAFPVTKSPGVRDSFPLMNAPARRAPSLPAPTATAGRQHERSPS